MELFDITIVGAGPAGLYATFYSGLRNMKTKLIDAQASLGGKLHVYPEKMVWDVGGLPPLSGQALINQLSEQARTFDPTVNLNEKIVSIDKDEEKQIFILSNTLGQKHYTKSVIIAVGSGILKPKTLEIEGIERLAVDNLHYTLTSIKYFKNRTVIISGGGNSAIDWANLLEPIAKKVILVYRQTMLKGHEQPVEQLLSSSVRYYPETSITTCRVHKNQTSITAVELTHCKTGATMEVMVDDVVVNHGYEQEATLLSDSPIAFDRIDDFYLKGTAKGETSVPGLYAAGDIISYEGKVNLIVGCFQDAVHAVNQAKRYIELDASESAMVSSHHHAFKDRNKAIRQNEENATIYDDVK